MRAALGRSSSLEAAGLDRKPAEARFVLLSGKALIIGPVAGNTELVSCFGGPP